MCTSFNILNKFILFEGNNSVFDLFEISFILSLKNALCKNEELKKYNK